MKKILLLLIPFLFISCITQTQIPGYYKDIHRFETGKAYTSEIGNPIIHKEEGYFVPAIYIKNTPSPKKSKFKHDITAGSIYIHKMSTSGKDLYFSTTGGKYAIAIDKKSKEAKFFMMLPEYLEFNEPLEYNELSYPEPGKKSLTQEFIYNGKSGSTVKFTYREFTGDYARPAFTQDIQYDLNDSKTIGFKGARIEIIEATNFTVKYVINKDFDK